MDKTLIRFWQNSDGWWISHKFKPNNLKVTFKILNVFFLLLQWLVFKPNEINKQQKYWESHASHPSRFKHPVTCIMCPVMFLCVCTDYYLITDYSRASLQNQTIVLFSLKSWSYWDTSTWHVCLHRAGLSGFLWSCHLGLAREQLWSPISPPQLRQSAEPRQMSSVC